MLFCFWFNIVIIIDNYAHTKVETPRFGERKERKTSERKNAGLKPRTKNKSFYISNDRFISRMIVILSAVGEICLFFGWRNFKGWLVLEFFLKQPSASIHVNELARRLGIGPSTAKAYLDEYASKGILSTERVANSRFFKLDGSSALVRELKKSFVLSELSEKKIVEKIRQENPGATSIILYGSRASGEYDEKSDYDFLVFSRDKALPKKAFENLNAETNATVLSLEEWRRKEKNFKESVAKNCIVLFGARVV